ncbi:tail fiber protein [Bradyrhizobium sp. 1050_B9_N1_2]|uniref:tail fiber protein n=1 Tax=Bradyrhizobium sp. 1050_B9_N1_2 TaxID=3238688 RepID=UPI003EDB977D
MPQSGVPAWSQTAATNANADSAVNFAEGQSPSSVNDSARALMASVAKWRDDNAGKLITGGTSTSYTLTTNTGFFSKATMDGAEIALTIHTTNGASPTLNVDGLGADPIIIDTVSSTTPVPGATLLTGGVYTLVYYNSGNTWRLKDFYQLPFTVPIGGMIDYFGTTAPSGNFVFPYGQAISRTTYATLFGMFSTAYGSGDGSTTFNIPDCRGRVIAGVGNMGGTDAGRLTAASVNSIGLGGVGGVQTFTITTANLPPYTPSGTIGALSVTSNNFIANNAGDSSAQNSGDGGAIRGVSVSTGGGVSKVVSTGSTTFTGTAQGGTSTPFALLQPTIIANKLLRII